MAFWLGIIRLTARCGAGALAREEAGSEGFVAGTFRTVSNRHISGCVQAADRFGLFGQNDEKAKAAGEGARSTRAV